MMTTMQLAPARTRMRPPAGPTTLPTPHSCAAHSHEAGDGYLPSPHGEEPEMLPPGRGGLLGAAMSSSGGGMLGGVAPRPRRPRPGGGMLGGARRLAEKGHAPHAEPAPEAAVPTGSRRVDLPADFAKHLPVTGDEAQDRLGEQIVRDLAEARSDPRRRADIGRYFQQADVQTSHEMMEGVRKLGLQDSFLDATLRDEKGRPVPAEVKGAVRKVLDSGKLDAYAETLATSSINVGDGAKDPRFDGFFYRPDSKGVYLSEEAFRAQSEQGRADVLAHELFHAFNDAHGLDGKGPGVTGALNEGFGVAAREHAFGGSFNLAEMVYGTKNYYRDVRLSGYSTDMPLGDTVNADPKLRDFLGTLASGDRSRLAWDDPSRLEADYRGYFEGIDRNQDFAQWTRQAEDATQRMLDARAATPVPEPSGLLGLLRRLSPWS